MRLRAACDMSKSTKANDRALLLSAGLFAPFLATLMLTTYYLAPPDRADVVVFCLILPEHLGTMFLAYLFDCEFESALDRALINMQLRCATPPSSNQVQG
jgi:hypothetical protein